MRCERAHRPVTGERVKTARVGRCRASRPAGRRPHNTGANPAIAADLATAAWADIVILAVADSADTACLLADPLAGTDAFRELLTWSLAGCVPRRYRPYAAPGPLLSDPILTARAILALAAMSLDAHHSS